jgi:hypothetical protein
MIDFFGDLYTKLAQEFGMNREEVKTLLFPKIYAPRSPDDLPLEEDCRRYLKQIVETGLIDE